MTFIIYACLDTHTTVRQSLFVMILDKSLPIFATFALIFSQICLVSPCLIPGNQQLFIHKFYLAMSRITIHHLTRHVGLHYPKPIEGFKVIEWVSFGERSWQSPFRVWNEISKWSNLCFHHLMSMFCSNRIAIQACGEIMVNSKARPRSCIRQTAGC